MDNPNQEIPRSSTTSVPPDDGHSQHYPPPGGQPQYPQPGGYGYPGNPFANYPPPSPQQQQQPQVIVTSNTQPVIDRPPTVDLRGAIALSCAVMWLCGMLLGMIAFILAVIGQSSASSGDNTSAIQLRSTSFCISIAGVVVGVSVYVVMAYVIGTAAQAVTTDYMYNTCYNYNYGRPTYYRC